MIVDHQWIAIFASVLVDTICFTGKFNRWIIFRFRLTAINFIQIIDIVKTRSTEKIGSALRVKVQHHSHFRFLDVVHGKVRVEQGGEIEWMIIGIFHR